MNKGSDLVELPLDIANDIIDWLSQKARAATEKNHKSKLWILCSWLEAIVAIIAISVKVLFLLLGVLIMAFVYIFFPAKSDSGLGRESVLLKRDVERDTLIREISNIERKTK